MDKRLTPEQKVMENSNTRAQAWHDAAARAEIRNEPWTARYFRNQAWRIENGKEWLDDITVTAPLVRQ